MGFKLHIIVRGAIKLQEAPRNKKKLWAVTDHFPGEFKCNNKYYRKRKSCYLKLPFNLKTWFSLSFLYARDL